MSNTGYVDGYDLDGFVAESPPTKSGDQMWKALEFTYRPSTRADNVRHDAEVRIALRDEYNDPECAVKAEKLGCEFVAKRIKSWSLKDGKDQNVPVSAEACSRLKSALFESVYMIIRGARLSDPKPQAADPEPGDEAQLKNSEREST